MNDEFFDKIPETYINPNPIPKFALADFERKGSPIKDFMDYLKDKTLEQILQIEKDLLDESVRTGVPFMSLFHKKDKEEYNFKKALPEYLELIKTIKRGEIPYYFPKYLNSWTFSNDLCAFYQETKSKFKYDEDFTSFEKENLFIEEGLCHPFVYFHKLVGFGNIAMDWIKALVELVIKDKPCFEVIAGSGAFSHALKLAGANVVATTDDFTWIKEEAEILNYYKERAEFYKDKDEELYSFYLYKIENINEYLSGITLQGAEWTYLPYQKEVVKEDALLTVEKHVKECDFLVLSFPPMDSSCYFIYKRMKALNPNCKMIYLGEDCGGNCASDEFFDIAQYASGYYEELSIINNMHVHFAGFHDQIIIFE